MPKKSKPNAFLYFMLDIKGRQESSGRRFRDMDEVKNVAGPLWEKMNKQQREPYVLKVQDEKLHGQKSGDKLTTLGIPISFVDNQKKDVHSNTEQISSRIASMVAKAVQEHTLEKLEVYFISFGYFCKIPNGTYIPAEMGLVRYSLEEGVMDKLHMLIDPGEIPIGWTYAAEERSKEDHQLPIPPKALGEKNFETIAVKVFEFLSRNGSDMPLLFTDREDVPMVKAILEDVMQGYGEVELLVCPLVELFFHLKNSSMKVGLGAIDKNTPLSACQQWITKDVYDYTANISCDYHEQRGIGKYCALSRCVRWAYIISESCCANLNIAVRPGKHLPGNVSLVPRLSTTKQTSNSEKEEIISFASISNVSRVTEAERSIGEFSGGTTRTRQPDASFDEQSAISELNDSMQSLSSSAWGGAPRQHPLLVAGRGSIKSLNIAKSTILGAGRGRKLPMEDFPPLGSSAKSFK